MSAVFVVMDEWEHDDDGDHDRDIHGVYADYGSAVAACYDNVGEHRHRYVVEMDVEP